MASRLRKNQNLLLASSRLSRCQQNLPASRRCRRAPWACVSSGKQACLQRLLSPTQALGFGQKQHRWFIARTRSQSNLFCPGSPLRVRSLARLPAAAA